jgi:hypothetical protein
MPSPKSKRVVILQSAYSPTNIISDLNLTMNASFVTPGTISTVNVEEDSSTSSVESSEWSMSFATVAAGPVGAITLSFAGQGDDLASGVGVARGTPTTTTVPRATAGTVTPIASPDAYFERVWTQPALDGATELVDQAAGLDMRVKAETGYTVTQSVVSYADDELIVGYEWKDATGGTVVSGTVKLLASSTAQGSYTLGDVTVTDDPPAAGRGTSFGGRGVRKALRERLRELVREIRRCRRDRGHR